MLKLNVVGSFLRKVWIRFFVSPRRLANKTTPRSRIVVGITHSQTSMVLHGRLRALREAGFHVTLVSSPGILLNRIADSEGIEAVPLHMARRISPIQDLVSLLRLCWRLFRIRPNMTEFSTPKAGLLGNLAACITGVPVRVYMLRGLRLQAAQGRQQRILLWAERLAASCAHVVLCNSESLRNEALALGIAPPGKLRLLGEGSSNGVDIRRFSPGSNLMRTQLRLPTSAPVVGFAGRLTYAKGLPDLIEAFELILTAEPSAHLLLVGWFDVAEDALSAAWRARIEDHPRIHLTGMVADTAPYYRAMDVMVLPTWREGFPNVVLEAAASGVPVVTTLSTGARDSVIPEVTGYLVPPGYPTAISEFVLRLIQNPERRHQMGIAARKWVVEHYADRQVLALTVGYYKALLQQHLKGKSGSSESALDWI